MKNILVSIFVIALTLSTHLVADTYYHDPGLKVGKYTTAEEYQQILKGNSQPAQSAGAQPTDYNFDDFTSGETFTLEQVSVSSENSVRASRDVSDDSATTAAPGSVILSSGVLQENRPLPVRNQGALSFSEVVESVQGTPSN